MWPSTPPSDERVDQLLDAEQDRQRREREVTAAAPQMAVGVDPDRGDSVLPMFSLRGEHVAPAVRRRRSCRLR
jgi:hypothetical protein